MKNKLLKEGDIVELKEGHTVYYKIPEHFIYNNRVGSFELSHTEICIGKNKNGLNTDFLKGKYVVVKTCRDGGGTGHGPNDVYPDGHHVFLEKINKDKYSYRIKLDFYQTGCFTAMIENIESIGRAELTYKIKS